MAAILATSSKLFESLPMTGREDFTVSIASNDRTMGEVFDTSPLPQAVEKGPPSAIIGVDRSQRIVAFSRLAEELLQRVRSEAMGRTIDSLPGPLRDAIAKTLSAGRAIEGQTILIPLANNTQRNFLISAFPTQDTSQAVTGAIVVLSDLSATRRLDENLRRMDRLASIGTLSASMAHEVKNAMVAVKTFVDVLVDKNQNAELAEIVVREMRRIDSIVTQMLRFSGPPRPAFDVLHLHEVLDHTLCLVQHHLEGRRIKLVRDFTASPDILRGNSYQLEQALLNLFLNALDAMGADGELTVTTELSTGMDPENSSGLALKLVVQDTGSGIAPEDLERLFEPFFTTKAEGTGLGLPITQRIIQEHRGTISASSKLHQGTTFTLRFPSAAKQP